MLFVAGFVIYFPIIWILFYFWIWCLGPYDIVILLIVAHVQLDVLVLASRSFFFVIGKFASENVIWLGFSIQSQSGQSFFFVKIVWQFF